MKNIALSLLPCMRSLGAYWLLVQRENRRLESEVEQEAILPKTRDKKVRHTRKHASIRADEEC